MARVLVGVDGSKPSEAALRWAGRYALATGDRVVAFHAERRPYAEIPPAEQQRLLEERSATVRDRWVQSATEMGVDVGVDVVEGDVREALLLAAERDDAALVVLGRTGAGGGPGFLHLGSVVEHTAHHTERPLAVVPADADNEIRRVVLGVDGSEESAAATRWVARIAGATGAEVLAAIVAEPIAEWTPGWDDKNWRRDAERELAVWLQPLTDAGVTVERVVMEQLHPADALLGLAAERNADLLVVGTRGAGGFSGLRFGGVAMKVLHHADMPLVLVPPQG